MMESPLAIDLCCGLGGWTEQLLDAGYFVIGFDIERHEYGAHRYPGNLVIQDVLTLHGSQLRDASLIVASPPCTEYSYMAMPWTRAKQIAAALRGDGEFPEGYRGSRTIEQLNALFDACFRIQREASETAGRHIPLIVENVRGAIPWVGPARWSFGSYYLWGDVPALMPVAVASRKVPGFRFDGSGKSFQSASVHESGRKSQGMNWSDRSKRGQDFTRLAGLHCAAGTKGGGDWLGAGENWSLQRRAGSGSTARKAASAMIAKIPDPLARHIAKIFSASQETRRDGE
jgi:hypothetical protein